MGIVIRQEDYQIGPSKARRKRKLRLVAFCLEAEVSVEVVLGCRQEARHSLADVKQIEKAT